MNVPAKALTESVHVMREMYGGWWMMRLPVGVDGFFVRFVVVVGRCVVRAWCQKIHREEKRISEEQAENTTVCLSMRQRKGLHEMSSHS
jgi:hypothetical protein